jgi:hypothetical protein
MALKVLVISVDATLFCILNVLFATTLLKSFCGVEVETEVSSRLDLYPALFRTNFVFVIVDTKCSSRSFLWSRASVTEQSRTTGVPQSDSVFAAIYRFCAGSYIINNILWRVAVPVRYWPVLFCRLVGLCCRFAPAPPPPPPWNCRFHIFMFIY